MMATIQGFHRRYCWSSKPIDSFVNAPFRFNHIMTRNSFDEIDTHIKYTSRYSLRNTRIFWEVHDMIEAWNDNMKEQFDPSGIS